jgi:hypothetical protein
VQSVLAAVVVIIFVVAGQDPVLALFTWLTNLGTLAIIALMAAASFAVVAFFRQNKNLESNVVRTVVAPVLAGIALIIVLVVAIANFDVLIGHGGVLVWLLPSLLIVAAVIGVVAAQILKTRSPELFAAMGRHRD